MRRHTLARILAGVLCTLTHCVSVKADGVDEWLKSHVDAAVGKKKATQAQSISIDHGSTSFVDQTSGTDLLNAALNLVPVNGGNGNKDGSGTVSASLYSVYTLATGQDALSPTVYNNHAGMRQLFFTLGREQQSTAGSTTTPAGTVYGFKWLIANKRDATSLNKDAKNDKALKAAQEKLQGILNVASNAASRFRTKLATLLVNKAKPVDVDTNEFLRKNELSPTAIDSVLASLGPSDRAEVTQYVQEYKDAVLKAGDIQDVVDILQQRYQLSVGFQTIQRSGSAANDYRAEIIFDRGLSKSVTFTANGSFDYSDSPTVGGDTHGGRGAIELKYDITKVSGFSLRSPLQLALAGEGVKTQLAWNYRAQLQLNIPITNGINLPLSFGYGNQADVLRKQESAVYGKFGLTFDFAKLVDALRGSH